MKRGSTSQEAVAVSKHCWRHFANPLCRETFKQTELPEYPTKLDGASKETPVLRAQFASLLIAKSSRATLCGIKFANGQVKLERRTRMVGKAWNEFDNRGGGGCGTRISMLAYQYELGKRSHWTR